MTVSKSGKRPDGKSKASSKKASKPTSSPLDNLIEALDTLETEEQVPEFLENGELLEESFKSLLSLMEGGEFEETCDKVDEEITEIMSKLLDESLIDEEEFEDFFTDEIDADSIASDDESDTGSSDLETETETEIVTLKQENKKKSKHLRELEMLMEKVADDSGESDLDGETEDESDEDHFEASDNDNDDIVGKKDIFKEDEEFGNGGSLSSFEKAQAALRSQIVSLETENINSERPWSLRGEINARQRPSDSLLEEAVDFDNLSRPVPQITEERSEEIEDIIKRRIGEGAWDDVERKDGRDLTLLNGMTKDQQKSARPLLEDVATAGPQRSLTQVYEDEASTKLTGQSAQDEETLEKQKDLTALFGKICRHVDGLSGNRFAPKVYVQSDFQIKTLGPSGKK